MPTIMKTFRKQFVECSDEGFHKTGPVKKFKDHPELLPSPWHRVAKVIAEKLKEDPDFGLSPILCLRFGGECSSGHPKCKELRKNGGVAQQLEQTVDNR